MIYIVPPPSNIRLELGLPQRPSHFICILNRINSHYAHSIPFFNDFNIFVRILKGRTFFMPAVKYEPYNVTYAPYYVKYEKYIEGRKTLL